MEHLKRYATARELEYIAAIEEHGTQRAAAEALGVGRTAVCQAIKAATVRAAKRGVSPEHDMTHPAAPGFSVSGTSTMYGPEGDIKAQWVKTKQETRSIEELIAEFTEGLKEDLRGLHKKIEPPKKNNEEMMAAYIIGDHHFGMFAWGEETGGDDWDTEIASKVLMDAVDRLCQRASDAHYGLLVNVGDFFHANDTTSLTPASKHSLDTDGRFGRTIRLAGKLFKHLVNRMLEVHKEVILINARGNHDPDSALWLNEMLRMYYSDEPRVTVLNNFSKFVWHRFGNNLIVTHHGDRIKVQSAYEAITRNLSKEWGECEHRFLWMGHIHHKQQHEIGGLLAETFNVLPPPDYWHSASGYGASRSMTCIMLHKDNGVDCRFQVNIQALTNHD